MEKNFNAVISASDADKYDPNGPDSVDNFWEEASIEHKGKVIGTAVKPDNLSDVPDIIGSLSDDFMQDGRNDLPPQERDFDL